jgi:hypothetical protein
MAPDPNIVRTKRGNAMTLIHVLYTVIVALFYATDLTRLSYGLPSCIATVMNRSELSLSGLYVFPAVAAVALLTASRIQSALIQRSS